MIKRRNRPKLHSSKYRSFTKPRSVVCSDSNILKLISATLLVLLTFIGHAQGGWNIGYLPVDSISKNHIGRVVRPDFKTKNPWLNAAGQRGIRSYVGTTDTGIVTIDTTTLMLAERRKIYADHGSYSEQYLECLNCENGAFLVYDAEIKDVDERSIELLLLVEVKEPGKSKSRQTRTVRLLKEKLDGVMFIEKF
jgi:hypothetical protein